MALAKEETVAKYILNFSSNTLKTAKQNQTKGYFVGRRKLLEEYWAKFVAAHEEISIIAEDDNNSVELKRLLSDDRFTKIEAAFCEALGELNDFIDGFSVTANSTIAETSRRSISAQGNSAKSLLPLIPLPTFDGSFAQWLTFKDMFTSSVIDDTSLSDVQRLHFLKSSLVGSAMEVLDNIPLSEANFHIAWELVQKRYDNKRRLLKLYFRNIFDLPTMTIESSILLRKLVDGATCSMRALAQMGRPTSHWDDWLVFLLTEKLDPVTVKEWETSLKSPNHIPTFDELHKFLENRLQGLEAVSSPASLRPRESNSKSQSVQPNVLGRCPCCSGKHLLMFCQDFRKKSPSEKLTLVTKAKLCKNCMKSDHSPSACPSMYSCQKCRQKHHTMLHESFPITSTNVNCGHTRTGDRNCEQKDVNNMVPLAPVLLATAQLGVRSATGHYLQLRALLDSGSQASFISEFAVQQLHLRRNRLSVPVTGVGGSTVGKSTGLVEISVSSLREPDFTITCAALILPRLGHLMPAALADLQPFEEFLHLDLADPKFNEPGQVDVILGADVYGSLLYGETKQLSMGAPVAQRTHLGWVIFGRLPATTPKLDARLCANTFTKLSDLVQSLWRFNNHEAVGSCSKMTQDEFYCEEFFERTVRRTSCGRYVIKYPFKNCINLADTKLDAYKLYHYQQARLEKDHKMKGLYDDFMSEYLKLGHMEPVPPEDPEPQRACYIPHHGVYKESSTTTKLRTVFNASRKNSSGISLNDCLHAGPKLQSDLSAIILEWRTHRIGFMTDIEKFYRQVLVEQDDADMQRIVWKDGDGNPAIFRLLTVTYGVKCSPYVAIKVLHTLAKDEEADFPVASKVLRRSFYVDDCFYGAHTPKAALELQGQLQKLLLRGGFVLRKWHSNSKEFLQNLNINEGDRESCCDLNVDRETKALGLYWFCHDDCLGYKVNVTSLNGPVTKRQQLSDLAKLYDPPCLLAPVVITGKIMAQHLWLAGCGWDDPLPEPFQQDWIKFRNELPSLEELKVPRWVFSSPDASSYQLHVFSDASTSAYAAVSYLRVIMPEGVKISLLIAKTKVAPLKKITVPCLELNGALLASKLAARVQDILQLPAVQLFCWSDSMTVLSWIRSNPGKHKLYIANRITKIQELTPIESWKYVPTNTNPADVASRGVYPSQVADLDIWWSGPPWLSKDEREWPKQRSISAEDVEITALVAAPCFKSKNDMLHSLLHKYSNINDLLAVTAWCQRFIAANLKKPHDKVPWSTAKERHNALEFWIRYVQNEYFFNEILCLARRKPIASKSKLLKLNPMLDDNGILRLNGRLKNAMMPSSERYPIILPKDSYLCTLLIAQAHFGTMHGGTQATLNFLRRRYWLIDARSAIQKHIRRRCKPCFTQRVAVSNQLMGNLPTHRCTAAPAFKHCGLDYGGPYQIRTTKGRGHRSYKGYVALFVCLSTRAIHLELVSDMTTETFLAALRRFFAVRGYSSDIYSDCATTFVGADTVLRDDLKAYRRQLEAGAHVAAIHGVSWHLIPPASPNFGGIWEAGIKSMKHHLKRTIGDATLTFEEFYTVLKQIEAVLNSRPISALSDDPTDLIALTPGHFLVGGPITAVPETSLLDTKTGRLTRWRQLQQMQQNFWKRWSCEYLRELQVRHKWRRATENLKVGDLVLVRDERTPPTQWALGRVLQVHPGEDDLVRVASVRTQSSIIKRSVSKLVALPMDADCNESNGGRPAESGIVSSHNIDEVGGNVKKMATHNSH